MKKFYALLVAALMTSTVGAQEYVTLDLTASQVPASFTFSNGSECWDSTYSENFPELLCPPFSLSHLCGGASYGGVYWDGFTVCRSADNAKYPDSQMLAHQWDVMPGGGIGDVADDGSVTVNGNTPYVLAYWSAWYGAACNKVKFTDGKSYKPVGMYVTNTCYAYYTVQGGTSSANAFTKEGDSFKLVAYGVKNNSEQVTSCEIELAGYHNGEFSGLTEWTWWDLSALGECDEIYFEMTSTDVGTWGINTPTYFAMDRLTVEAVSTTAISELQGDRQVAGVTYVNLAGAQSSEPFDGLNIVVTRYTDGTTSTSKVMR